MSCFKPVAFLKIKQFVNEQHDYEFTGEVKMEECEDEEEILTMAVDEDRESLDEKTEGKKEDVFKPLNWNH